MMQGADSSAAAKGGDVFTQLVASFREAKLKAAEAELNNVGGKEATQDAAAVPAAAGGGGESMVIFVGDQEAGRTSLIQAFLNPSRDAGEKTKPTVALEYLFARRSGGGGGTTKDIAHIWDLGGGSQLSELVRVPVKADCLGRTSFVIVLDLSKPQNVLAGALYWLRLLKNLTAERLEELRGSPTPALSAKAEALAASGKAKYAKDHVDRRAVSPLNVPVVLLCNKYDTFKDLDGVKRKLVSQALRFVAHHHGASLVFASTREKPLRDQYRHVASHLLFRTPLKRLHETNGEKPVVVLAGMDSFADITAKGVGPPSLEAQDLLAPALSGINDRAYDTLKAHFEKILGPPTSTAAGVGKGDDDAIYLAPEPLIDETRKIRDEALERYRKESQRRKDLAAMERRQQQSADSKPAAPSTASSSSSGAASSVAASKSSSSLSSTQRRASSAKAAAGESRSSRDKTSSSSSGAGAKS